MYDKSTNPPLVSSSARQGLGAAGPGPSTLNNRIVSDPNTPWYAMRDRPFDDDEVQVADTVERLERLKMGQTTRE